MDDLRDEGKRINRLIAIDKSTLPPDGGDRFNRLIFTTSPYLLQHADNPVEWHPWGDDAFARAAAEDKPVFLSIGYSTCHWCHVMAHESFEDPDVAAVMNRTFVCIKVDREERPDIDEQYMAVAQLMTGSGGWPLNIFMTGDRKPFYAATYIPRHSGRGMPGVVDVFEYFDRLWLTDRQKLLDNSVAALSSLNSFFRHEAGPLPDAALMDDACRQLAGIYDKRSGGFGTAPKFPMPLFIDFLLTLAAQGLAEARSMAESTLTSMRYGGIYDQLGYGFHRYSTDSGWLVPHFEKMLYDQALLSSSYLNAFRLTGDSRYLRVAEEILQFVADELTAPDGGFYSGQDADTGGEEGRSYLWTPAEIEQCIGAAGAEVFCRLFGVSEGGNFEGASILHLTQPVAQFSAAHHMAPEQLDADLEQWRTRLLAVRAERVQPFRDEKIITAWNGMMISACAAAYGITGSARYLEAAERAARFVMEHVAAPDGRLMRSYHLGRQSDRGFLDDYACFTAALVDLHQVTLDRSWLELALQYAAEMLRLFAGDAGDALNDSGCDAETVLVRHRSSHDGVVPCGNSAAAAVLLRLGLIADDPALTAAGEGIVQAFMGSVRKQPLNSLNFLTAHTRFSTQETLITLSGSREDTASLVRVAYERFIPNLILRNEGTSGSAVQAAVCARGTCWPPVGTAEDLRALLGRLD